MDSKRKSIGGNGAKLSDDRAAKRRKIEEEFGDLTLGESTASTTAFGLNIIESLRATTDKSGRSVSPFFERLPSRAKNPGYYKNIRLPLSIQIIEQKLKDGLYPTLTTLEGDFKRLVSNAKETLPRNSSNFDDAERVRKAISNLMVKYNPAYKAGNYQAVATPLPPTPQNGAGDVEEDAEGEDVDMGAAPNASADADGDGDKDAEGEEDVEEEDDGDDDDVRGSRRRAARRTKRPDRRSKKTSTIKISTPVAPVVVPQRSGKADHHFENLPFKGLSLQQAQEKIVEEIIRAKDEDDYLMYEIFLTLPPRSLKDYYEVIAEPTSLKGIQKQVRGQHGRGEPTFVTDFKTWTAFEDQASLIWKNAYHYNEDGSEIFSLAQELEKLFTSFLAEAKQHVSEPAQPKIKLRIPQGAAEPAPPHPKKITIHVGGKSSAAASPAPATGQSAEGERSRNGTPMGRNPFGGGVAVPFPQINKTRSASNSVPSPSPAPGHVKAEEIRRASPAIAPQPATVTFQHFAPPVMHAPQVPNGVAAPQPPPAPPAPKLAAADILEGQKYRPRTIKESDAILSKLTINSHPSLNLDNRLSITVPASTTEAQQELVINAPSSHYRLQLRPSVAPFLEAQQREWKLNVAHDNARLYPNPHDKRELVFDTNLRYGMNRLDVALVAALPKGQKAPNGLTMEMERFVVHFNLLKHA